MTCPAGQTATIPTTKARRRQARFGARVVRRLPATGPLHQTSGGRIVEINDDEELLIAARQARWTPEFRQRYRERARVERKNAQLKSRGEAALARRAEGNAWLKLRMAALNLDNLGRMAVLAA